MDLTTNFTGFRIQVLVMKVSDFFLYPYLILVA